MNTYVRPQTLDHALEALAKRPHVILAGGTDFYPARVERTLRSDVLDITGIPELAGIREDEHGWRIGAAVTWRELQDTPLPAAFDALKLAAREIGGPQIQNAGTIAGNVCNASPAADGIPALAALDASVEIAGPSGHRRVALADFLRGPRRVDRSIDELVTALHVPRPAARSAGHFLKLGARRYLVISIVMAAAVLEADETGVITRARVAVGACSPVACRLTALEDALAGKPVASALGHLVQPEHLAALMPIDDIRASRVYRVDAAQTLVARLLQHVGEKL